MRKRVFALVTVPNEPWRERLGKVVGRRSNADNTIRTLSAEELARLHGRARHAAAERLFTPKPQA